MIKDDYTSKTKELERHSKAMTNLKKCKQNEADKRKIGYKYKRVDSKTLKLVKDAKA